MPESPNRYKTKSKDPRPGFEAFNADKSRAYVENFDLYSIDDRVCLDFVGTYENLGRDFDEVLKKIGLAGNVSLGHVNRSDDRETRNYRDMYTDESREMMARWYAREIAYFGYEF